MRNGRCRLHGGKSVGQPNNRHAWVDGSQSHEAKAVREAAKVAEKALQATRIEQVQLELTKALKKRRRKTP
jgi:hypothetical protein